MSLSPIPDRVSETLIISWVMGMRRASFVSIFGLHPRQLRKPGNLQSPENTFLYVNDGKMLAGWGHSLGRIGELVVGLGKKQHMLVSEMPAVKTAGLYFQIPRGGSPSCPGVVPAWPGGREGWGQDEGKSPYCGFRGREQVRQRKEILLLLVVSYKLCLTLCDPMDCSPPGFSVHGILQARILEGVAISSSRGSSPSRDRTHVSCIGRWILHHWATWEAEKPWFRAKRKDYSPQLTVD